MTFLIICIRLVETPNEDVAQAEFKDSYGSITDDVRIESAACKQYYPIYMIRRIVYALILIALAEYPVIQLIIVPIVVVVPVCARKRLT